MLCTIEDVKRILKVMDHNITIGSDTDDNISEEDVTEYIKDTEVLINGYLAERYEVPLSGRLLLSEQTPIATMSLETQSVATLPIEVSIRGSGDLSANNTVVIVGTDKDDQALTETLTFTIADSAQSTKRAFKTVDTDGITIGTNIINLTDAKIQMIAFDIVSYICQRLTAYFIYIDIYTSNFPNDASKAIHRWYDDAMKWLKKIADGDIILEGQTAPTGDPQILERPVYNTPSNVFTSIAVPDWNALYRQLFINWDEDIDVSD
jgi:phage gp36-like protein